LIGTQTPFRISFAGGGTDLKEFYSQNIGCVVSTTINKYMFIFVHPFFDQKTQVKYSRTELVDDINEIKHPIVRELLKKFGLKGIDINSIADIPAGTGLGSSSSFTVGLLHTLYAYISKYPSKEQLAREACELEIEVLKEPIGKQDQYAASYGGLNCITFYPNGSVNVEPVIMPPEKLRLLEENLLIFYLGVTRPAKSILKNQKKRTANNRTVCRNLEAMAELAIQLRRELSNGNIKQMGLILDENWRLKRELSKGITEGRIDYYYDTAIKNGAVGGKLLGAGGGGFLLFYCEKENQEKLRRALKGLREVKFRFDIFGTKIIYVSDNGQLYE
jgi:D-glycero-alpha-D-manno-heptose-7-phosphate kinase